MCSSDSMIKYPGRFQSLQMPMARLHTMMGAVDRENCLLDLSGSQRTRGVVTRNIPVEGMTSEAFLLLVPP